LGEPNGKPLTVPDRKTVLVVEDDVFTRLAIADDLMSAGFRVVQAATAKEAMTVLQSSVEVDLVTTDIHMPGGMNGIELAQQVRSLRPELKIIVLSSDSHAGRSAGAGDLFIEKPYQTSDLLKGVKELLGTRDDERS
jgi:CheY-like chemotaxis protein